MPPAARRTRFAPEILRRALAETGRAAYPVTMSTHSAFLYRLGLVLPPLAGGLLLVWTLGRQGSLGAFFWGYSLPFILVGLVALLPLLVRLAWALAARLAGAGDGGPLAGRVCGLLGGLALAAIVALGAVLVGGGASRLEIPAGLRLLEPAAGLAGGVPGQIRVAISSDPHFDRDASDHSGTERLLGSVRAAGYDAFFLLGDSVDTGLLASGWNRALPILAAGLGPVPLRALLGNHDAIVNGEGHFRQAFFPEGMKSDSGSPFYYSIDAGPVRFFVLNLPWGSEAFDAAQRQWLESALAATPPGVFKVALSHCFFRSSGYVDPDSGLDWFDHAGTLRDVAPILARHGVDLVVSGHNHYLEYLEGDGLHYAVVGAMGGPSDSQPSHMSPASRWFRRGVTGFLDLGASAGQLDIVFRDAGGAELHRAVLKHNPG
jgi:predicted phosphodiesterase